LFDTHAHLDQADFDADRADVLRRAAQAGVEAVVCVGVDVASSRAAIQLAQQHPAVYAAVGIQPNSAGQAQPGDWEHIVALAQQPRVVAIGETGLDRYWDFTPFAVQQEYFLRHLHLAQATGLPILIHCRQAEADLLPMLQHAGSHGPLRGLLHAFSADAATATAALELGLYISFAGNVTYTNKKFQPLVEVARQIPSDRILLETDSPYLVPHPLRGKQKRNEPAFMAHTLAGLAALRNVSAAELDRQTTANARTLFGLQPPPVPT